MPRQPTGRPPGRPRGSGQLDNPTRLTVWLSSETYARLEAYADGRHYHRGDPQLSACVRELLEHALACPYKNQTQNIPVLHGDNNRPIENVLAVAQNISEQIETITAAPENNYYEQIQTVPLVTENISEQIETVSMPAAHKTWPVTDTVTETVTDTVTVTGHALGYDTSRYYLGKLCPRGHDYEGTGQSLLRQHNQRCRDCENEAKRARYHAKRQATVL